MLHGLPNVSLGDIIVGGDKIRGDEENSKLHWRNILKPTQTMCKKLWDTKK
jgi:hypothetical protein